MTSKMKLRTLRKSTEWRSRQLPDLGRRSALRSSSALPQFKDPDAVPGFAEPVPAAFQAQGRFTVVKRQLNNFSSGRRLLAYQAFVPVEKRWLALAIWRYQGAMIWQIIRQPASLPGHFCESADFGRLAFLKSTRRQAKPASN